MSSKRRAKEGGKRRKGRLKANTRLSTTVRETTLPNGGVALREEGTSPYKKRYRGDEAEAHHDEVISEKSKLVQLIDQGVPVCEALKQVNSSRSVSSARKIYKRYQEKGPISFRDRRWERDNPTTVMVPEVVRLVEYFYYQFPAATIQQIKDKVCEHCGDLPKPGYESVKLYLRNLPEAMKLARKGPEGLKEWDKFGRQVGTIRNTLFSNDRWQIDHCHLPVFVRTGIYPSLVAVLAYLTSALCTHSRSIPGIIVSTIIPDSWAIKLLLRKSILPKENPEWLNHGMPKLLQCDRGQDFLSKAVGSTTSRLGISLIPDPARCPDAKGKKERWFRTLNDGYLRGLVSHQGNVRGKDLKDQELIAGFPTIEDLRSGIEGWIVNTYHKRPHSETGRAPGKMWLEDMQIPRMPESEDELHTLLLQDDKKRTISNRGIEFTDQGVAHRYAAPALADYFGREVRIRYNPEEMQSVYVYCAGTGEFICEAWDTLSDDPRYTEEEFKGERKEYRRALVERTKRAAEQAERTDRKPKARHMLKQIRDEQKRAGQEASMGVSSRGSSGTVNADSGLDLDLIAAFEKSLIGGTG